MNEQEEEWLIKFANKNEKIFRDEVIDSNRFLFKSADFFFLAEKKSFESNRLNILILKYKIKNAKKCQYNNVVCSRIMEFWKFFAFIQELFINFVIFVCETAVEEGNKAI